MFFAPDHAGIALYATDCARYLSEAGHTVTVVTSFPWYPNWEKRKEDRGKLFRVDIIDAIHVIRGYIYVPKKVTVARRILQEIAFLIFAFFNFLRAGKQDVIIVFTTPVNLSLIAAIYKKLWRAKLIINVQDLQVDIAPNQSIIMRGIIKVMAYIEKFTYKSADVVTSISDGMLDLIRMKGINEGKLYSMPNWIDVSQASSKGLLGNFRKANPEYHNKTIIAYAGNIGEKQGLETLIDLAAHYKDEKRLIFLVIGAGGALTRLKTYASLKQCHNVHFLPFLSPNRYFDMLTDIDAAFISLKVTSADVFFPSKLLGLMAKAKVVMVSANPESELYRTVQRHNIGLVSSYGNIAEMKNHVNQILQGNLSELKNNAYRYVQSYDRYTILPKFEQLINRLVGLDSELIDENRSQT